MTVTPLRSEHRTSATSPPGRRVSARRRRANAESPAADALTVTFEVTLAGESRYQDALAILESLRDVTDRLGSDRVGSATLDVVPATGFTASEDTFVTRTGVIQIMPDSRSVIRDGEEISLTRVEFDLLTFLAENPRRVFGRPQLLKSVWGYEQTGQRTVDVHIRRIRAKLGDRLVTTVRSVGYRLSDGARVSVGSRAPA